jgi:hypothetical protein
MILRNSKYQMTDPKSLLSLLNALIYEIIGIVKFDRPINFLLDCERVA